jgi:diacylglycerol O-acyltransferase / trehalose O-mycolyltransferase
MYRNRTLNHWFRHTHMWRHWTGWCVVLASLVLFCGCSAATSSTASPPATAAGTSEVSVAASSPSAATSGPQRSMPARVLAKKRLAEREEDLTIESPAVGGQVKVRLLLPVHYETEKARLWPVLYLLHGCCDS